MKVCEISVLIISAKVQVYHGRIQRGDRGSRSPLKNEKNIGFHSNTGPDPLKNHKATKVSKGAKIRSFDVGPSSTHQ